jgi:hypothetical protein
MVQNCLHPLSRERLEDKLSFSFKTKHNFVDHILKNQPNIVFRVFSAILPSQGIVHKRRSLQNRESESENADFHSISSANIPQDSRKIQGSKVSSFSPEFNDSQHSISLQVFSPPQ